MSHKAVDWQHGGRAVDRNWTVVSTSIRSPRDAAVEVGVALAAAAEA